MLKRTIVTAALVFITMAVGESGASAQEAGAAKAPK